METINQVFDKFLADESRRLKKTTLNKYRQVMELFGDYMNSYAHNYLKKEEGELFREQYRAGNEFCEIFGPEKITGCEIQEFLSYFMIRKVVSSSALMKNTRTVMRRFITWLKDSSYIDIQEFESFQAIVSDLKDDLPQVVELRDLLVDEGNKNNLHQFEAYEEGYFLIHKVEAGRLWLEDYMGSDLKIGPVVVSKTTSSLAKVGWAAYLKLGRRNGKWYIIESGNVYP
jgi:hypothetical protein